MLLMLTATLIVGVFFYFSTGSKPSSDLLKSACPASIEGELQILLVLAHFCIEFLMVVINHCSCMSFAYDGYACTMRITLGL